MLKKKAKPSKKKERAKWKSKVMRTTKMNKKRCRMMRKQKKEVKKKWMKL